MLGHEPAGVVVASRVDGRCPRPARACSSTTTCPCGDVRVLPRAGTRRCARTFKATRIEPGGFSELILVPALNAALDLLRAARLR